MGVLQVLIDPVSMDGSGFGGGKKGKHGDNDADPSDAMLELEVRLYSIRGLGKGLGLVLG